MNALGGWCTLDFIYGALLFFSADLITMFIAAGCSGRAVG